MRCNITSSFWKNIKIWIWKNKTPNNEIDNINDELEFNSLCSKSVRKLRHPARVRRVFNIVEED